MKNRIKGALRPAARGGGGGQTIVPEVCTTDKAITPGAGHTSKEQ